MKTKKKIKVKIVPCQIWSRCVGYFRPTDDWNAGKLEEFKHRKFIDPKQYDINSPKEIKINEV